MAAPDFSWTEGFDKYGLTGIQGLSSLLLIGDWSTQVGGTYNIVDALAGPGNALQVTISGSGGAFSGITKNLPNSYARHLGGCYHSTNLGRTTVFAYFLDTGTGQLCFQIETTGFITVRRGYNGTILATSTESVSASAVHCFEWDVTIDNSAGIVKLWIDGVLSSINLSGVDTQNSANASANQFAVGVNNNGGIDARWDHVYGWHYLVSGGSETPALTNPYVETSFATADSAVQFSPAAGVLGDAVSLTSTTNAPAAGSLFLRKFTPVVNMTLNSVSCVPKATSAGAHYKPVIYADSAGAPGSLLSTGAELTGTTSGTTLTGALTTPQALTAGTQYWIGFINDTSVALALADTNTLGYRAANTYASGAPGTAPAMTSGQASWEIWGNCTGQAANYPQINVNPELGTLSYNQDTVVGHEDLYTFGSLTSSPTTIYGVSVKAMVSKSDSGARTIDLETKSGATTSAGSNAGQAPTTSIGMLASYFSTDPSTGLAWTLTGLNSAKHGVKIAS